MQLVVSCDYLISPAFCEHDNFAERIRDLISIKREVEGGGNRVVLEKNSLSKLQELGYYPCAPLFKNNIPEDLKAEFSPKDIAKVIHNITSAAINAECVLPECVAYWTDKSIQPVLQGTTHHRSEAVSQLVEDVFLAAHFFDRTLSILHHPLENNVIKVTVKGMISGSIPDPAVDLPINLENDIPLYSRYQKFLSQFSSHQTFNNAQTPEGIIEAINTRALDVARDNNKGGINKFRLGPNFLPSLNEHQCAPGDRFSDTAFEAICHAVAGVPKYPHKPMYSDVRKKIQVVDGAKLGWRTHVTKSSVALRLMFWTDGDVIELANIGAKNALVIL
ncbi:hypothetical protein V2K91_19335 [Pseudomonas alliivorans]|nr:hypothetical protein [Pseudomonas alliivorans]